MHYYPPNTSPVFPSRAIDPIPLKPRRLMGWIDLNLMTLGIMGRPELLLVPPWVVEQLYNPETPRLLRQEGSEDAREYLRDMYDIDGTLTVFWWGTLLQALQHAAHSLNQMVPPADYLTDTPLPGEV